MHAALSTDDDATVGMRRMAGDKACNGCTVGLRGEVRRSYVGHSTTACLGLPLFLPFHPHVYSKAASFDTYAPLLNAGFTHTTSCAFMSVFFMVYFRIF
uniref:Transmembrane protein n=1 Tax=Steinernema glaseri TaxID=37863 RepID=A0A1I7YB37_9BILA